MANKVILNDMSEDNRCLASAGFHQQMAMYHLRKAHESYTTPAFVLFKDQVGAIDRCIDLVEDVYELHEKRIRNDANYENSAKINQLLSLNEKTESLRNLAEGLINEGAVALTLDEELLTNGQLLLKAHGLLQSNVRDSETYTLCQRTETATIADKTYTFECVLDPDPPHPFGFTALYNSDNSGFGFDAVSLDEGLASISIE